MSEACLVLSINVNITHQQLISISFKNVCISTFREGRFS